QRVRELLSRGRYRGERLSRDLGLAAGLRELVGPTVNVIGFTRSVHFGPLEATIPHLWAGPINDLNLTVGEQPSGPPLIDLEADASQCSDDDLADHGRRLGAILAAPD